jgi:hypothetical protein
MSTTTTTSQSATSPTRNKLDDYARWGLWALPVWAALLAYGTLTHQPSPQPSGYASYVTTTEFLIHHLLASIFGAGVGILGLTALFIVLCKGRAAPLALWALVLGVIGNTLDTAGFGVAAFAQSAIAAPTSPGTWPRPLPSTTTSTGHHCSPHSCSGPCSSRSVSSCSAWRSPALAPCQSWQASVWRSGSSCSPWCSDRSAFSISVQASLLQPLSWAPALFGLPSPDGGCCVHRDLLMR